MKNLPVMSNVKNKISININRMVHNANGQWKKKVKMAKISEEGRSGDPA